MALAQSKVTSQGQVSVPAAVRQRLGIRPGNVIQWDEVDGNIVVRRMGRFSSADLHTAVFGGGTPKAKTLTQLKQGIRQKMKARHAGH